MHLFPCQQAQEADRLFSKVNSVGQGFLTWGASNPSVLKSISGDAGEGYIRGGQRFVQELSFIFLLFLSMLVLQLLFLFWRMNQAYDQDVLHLSFTLSL